MPDEELTESPDIEADSDESEEQAPSDDPLDGDEELQQAFYDLYLECCGEDRYPRLIEVKVFNSGNLWAVHHAETAFPTAWAPHVIDVQRTAVEGGDREVLADHQLRTELEHIFKAQLGNQPLIVAMRSDVHGR